MREFYNSQDVQDAEWLIQTNDSLNHGIAAMLWAWRVIKWYMDMYLYVRSKVIKGLDLSAAISKAERLYNLGLLRFGVG